MSDLKDAPLGKKSEYIATYTPDLLHPIPRSLKRNELGIETVLPFQGGDIWNAFEVSWLNEKGKPVVAIGQFIFSCESPNLIESKSLKLYLNSFNNTQFKSFEDVAHTIIRDLSKAAGAPVIIEILPLTHVNTKISNALNGICIDDLDIECHTYQPAPELLTVENQLVIETVYSDLLKSNCLVTGQPDWGSVQISYSGNKINHENLLQYIISFRNHNEFHEQCVERIFIDIMHHCQPKELLVCAHYTRRGGLDINPYRSTDGRLPASIRLIRQ